jgi:hypothetical protein
MALQNKGSTMSNDPEIWKPVAGYEDAYEVSSLGNVRSCDRLISKPNRWGGTNTHWLRGRILKAHDNGCGYLAVSLSVEGLRVGKLVHRLVAEAFLPFAPDRPFVNHIDGDKRNNALENLEWCTRSENMQHAYDTGLLVSNKNAVIGTCVLTGVERVFASQIEGEILLSRSGRQSSAIHNCLTGKSKTAYGYRWRLA